MTAMQFHNCTAVMDRSNPGKKFQETGFYHIDHSLYFYFPPRLFAFTYFSESSVNCLVCFFFVSCSECLIVISGRESAMCLLHLVGTRSLVAHIESFFFIVGAPLNVTGSCPLIELVFGDPIYLSLVVPAPKSLWLQVFCLIWLDIHCTCSLGKDVFICPYVLYPGLYAPMCYILGKQKCLKLDPCPQRAHGIVE